MKSTGRVPTGLPGLDERIAGGFPANRAVLVCGDIGTGKTTFGVQFLVAGAAAGYAGIFVSVDEKPRHIVDDMRRFGWDLSEGDSGNLVTTLDASAYFTALRSARPPEAYQVAHDLIQHAGRVGARRLVIDGVGSLVPAGASAIERADFLRMVITALESNLTCTTVLTSQSCEPADQFTAGVVRLDLGPIDGEVSRSLTVQRMQGVEASPASLTGQRFDIVDGQGLVVRGTT